MDVLRLSAAELVDRFRRGELDPVEVTEAYLRRIEEVDGLVGAYLTVDREGALRQAGEASRRWREGEGTSLTGVPLAIKDNICTKGLLTTCASKILGNFVPPYDATVVERLRSHGAVILGKTNLDEFAMGSSTENSGFKTTRNPWSLDRIPGGSSGGSAAAVAAHECVAALGSDTGGSIRQPAALCGVVGLKPTYGRVSRYGLVAFASSLDQIGPLSRTVRDCALLLEAIAGHDPRDSTSVPLPQEGFVDRLEEGVEGLRLGVPKEYFVEGMDPEVEGRVWEAIKVLQGLGVEVEEVSLPHTEYAIATYYIICTAEASSNLARYDGVKYGLREGEDDLMEMYLETRSKGFGPEVKRRIMLGTYVLSAGYYDAYYRKASQVRTLIKEDFERVLERCDLIVTPTSPTPAFGLGEKVDDPLQMYLSDIFTISANLAGLPALSVPCGFNEEGLPIGLQLIGKPFDEATLLRVAYAFEGETRYHLQAPELDLKGTEG
ncbi:MAG: Asp-tRNA(Asn)/Glu-tRNA(Gln) amidotransferase GatCAB subunit A [Deltaproteobacteria bacterium]|nr:MAG: Asp-tRNA(Asn)/Glu-tRNA(Gln) amidotransferase GatCAB subunit A [Deltaproteobacteria bacterium]